MGARERKYSHIERTVSGILTSLLVSEGVLPAGGHGNDKSLGQETFHCLRNPVSFSLSSQLGIRQKRTIDLPDWDTFAETPHSAPHGMELKGLCICLSRPRLLLLSSTFMEGFDGEGSL